MKVTAWKTVEVECECDVALEDILNECGQRIDEAEDDYYRRALSALDTMTRIMARLPDTTIAKMKPEHRAILRERLATEAARYVEKVPVETT